MADQNPNATDPVDDPAYPLIVAVSGEDQADVPDGWDTHPELAGTSRAAHESVLEPDDAWAALQAHDEAAG